jgi:hypothetical protein
VTEVNFGKIDLNKLTKMNFQISGLVLWLLWNIKIVISDATDYNTINKDGSFAFG